MIGEQYTCRVLGAMQLNLKIKVSLYTIYIMPNNSFTYIAQYIQAPNPSTRGRGDYNYF
jgi:hypothetical protein